MIVWIVELRETNDEGTIILDTTVMHVASTKEKAEAWIKRYPDACSGEWHWWIGCDPVDEDSFNWDHQWMTYDPDGRTRYESDSAKTSL